MAGRAPDFLIVGSRRCGTSAMRRALNAHPDIEMPAGPDNPDWGVGGEFHFFDRYFSRGMDWYHEEFAHTTARLVGEKTPVYILPRPFNRMRRALPDIKVVLLLRNPAERLRSDYFLQVSRMGRWGMGSFSEWLPSSHGKACMRLSLYSPMVERLFEGYPRDRIFIETHDNVSRDFQGVSEALAEFLGAGHYPAGVSQQPELCWKTSKCDRFPRRMRIRMCRLFADDLVRLRELLRDWPRQTVTESVWSWRV